MLALISTALLPLHLGGGAGALVGIGYGLAGVALAGASMGFGAHRLQPHRARQLRYWAPLGAVGFLVSGAGLLADVLDWPMVLSEVLAIVAVAAWWIATAAHLLSRVDQQPDGGILGGARALGYVSLVCAVLALAAVVGQLVWDAPIGAVPARFAYLLWGPWGLVLATRLARVAEPV